MKKPLGELTINKIGEWGLLDRIAKFYSTRKKLLLAGFPEDVSIIDLSSQLPYYLVLTCDMLVEGTHFLAKSLDFYSLGRKSVAINLSDVASKGAEPNFILISLGLPSKTSVRQVDHLYKGIKDEADRFGCHIAGGDTVGAEHLTINICVIGKKDRRDALPGRNRATPGQNVFVTGHLGDSGAGCLLLKSNRFKNLRNRAYARALINRHKQPNPRVKEGQILSKDLPDLSMIDISDGLYNELQLLARFSRVGFNVLARSIPLSPQLLQFCGAQDQAPLDFALFGGEDFELLFTTSAGEGKVSQIFKRHKVNTLVAKIGKVTADSKIKILDAQDKPIKIKDNTYRHF